MLWQDDKKSSATQLIVGLAITGVVGAAELARRLFRRSRLFCPSDQPLISWNPADYGLDPDRVDEVYLQTADGETLHGWYCRAEEPIASALYCHGNTGNLTFNAHCFPHLVRRGISVFTFDYRGYGRSSGRPSVRGVIRDAVTAARWHAEHRPEGTPALAYGFSLGGAIAAQLVRIHDFDAMILQSTFTSLPEIARAAFPRFPVHIISGNDFDTLGVVRELEIPLLVIHGASDEAIPCSMASTLYESCPVSRGLEIVQGGAHKNLFEVAPDRIGDRIHTFVRQLISAENKSGVLAASTLDLEAS
ncbi:MAG TPA: alpha/beta fold hydrolase [Thermoanaerobaculia bacterium]|nr:alpha/beta fold hydrolase [Thermoanaerobaculia bacterium]